jgi:hypothetical protein
LISEK